MTWVAAPALPLDEAGKYVAAAYVVFLALILIYVAIMATKLTRIDRELTELAEAYTHPRVLSQTGGSLPGDMRLTFLVALVAMTLLFVTLWKFELTAKHASMQLKKLRRRRAEREAVAA